ncbi:DMT family transporter [Sphingomonas baiyangensis]|uniref:DMT family transporter n=1 Tax=Sphingomonas baiyangensis TaxID=2572576 RepID=A0A4U1L9H6_9SPHN|nr:DMT family transporter [Sphingomonas baiyangensis]TKD53213.1 DMT family transporter [Sphingomonas baiyangensis]
MPTDRIMTGLVLRLVAVLLLASMGALVKLAETRGASLVETMFWRQACAIPVVLGWLALGAGVGTIRTQRFGAHVGRTAMGLIGMTATFAALMLLPLAEATTLQFTAPIFATLLGALVLREPTGVHRWGAVLAGFVGIVIVAQPGSGAIPLAGAAVGLASGFLIAVISILLRQIGRTESAGTTVFWFSALSMLPLGALYAFRLQPHDAATWAVLGGIGLFGGAGQIALTAALRYAPVSVAAPMDYSSLVWASLWGWLLFGTLPSDATWVGAPIIIASGLYIAFREHRLARLRAVQSSG